MVFNRVNYTVKPSILPGPAHQIQHARTARRILHFSQVSHARRADEVLYRPSPWGEAARSADEGSPSTFSVEAARSADEVLLRPSPTGEGARRANVSSSSTFSVGEAARSADEGVSSTFSVGEAARSADEGFSFDLLRGRSCLGRMRFSFDLLRGEKVPAGRMRVYFPFLEPCLCQRKVPSPRLCRGDHKPHQTRCLRQLGLRHVSSPPGEALKGSRVCLILRIQRRFRFLSRPG